MRSPVRVVLLDMGGVLIHLGDGHGLPYGEPEPACHQALVQALEQAGGRPTGLAEAGPAGTERAWNRTLDTLLFGPWQRGYRQRYERGAEEPWEPHLARLRAATGAEISDEALLAAWFEPFGETLPALPGAAEALRRLQERGLSLGLVSNVPLPGFLYRRVLERHRLLAPFETLRFSHDAGVRKPRPGMLLQVLDELSANPSEAVMVGDRKDADIAAGRAAGVRTVWLTSGRREEADHGPEPDWTLVSVAELPEALLRIEAEPRLAGGVS